MNRTQGSCLAPVLLSSTEHNIPLVTHRSSDISGLPQQKEHLYYRDVHMDTAKGLTGAFSNFDVRMGTAKGLALSDDIAMETAKGGTTMKQGGFQMWERELLESAEMKRKATVAQLCEYSHILRVNTYSKGI